MTAIVTGGEKGRAMVAVKANDLIYALREVLALKRRSDSPVQLKDMLCTAQYLSVHPLQKEPFSYQVQYLYVLEYFIRKLARTDLFAVSGLYLYKKVLLRDRKDRYHYDAARIESLLEAKKKNRKYQGFQLLFYRYVLLLDLLFLCGRGEERREQRILCTVQKYFSSPYIEELTSWFDALLHERPAGKAPSGLTKAAAVWNKNRKYRRKPLSTVLFVANMSAGKSTLINALTGKTINRAQNQACTAKLHYIYRKSVEDGFICEYDYVLDPDADRDTLMQDNEKNTTNRIMAGTAFHFIAPSTQRFCFLDTPGANYSRNEEHEDIAHRAIYRETYDQLVYVMAAGSTGTDDDRVYLQYVKEHHRAKRLIFVLNKLDTYNSREDSVEESLQKADADLRQMGFANFQLYPLSARAGFMAKQVLCGVKFGEDTLEYLEQLRYRALFRGDMFDFGKYYPVTDRVLEAAREKYKSRQDTLEWFLRTGLFGLEYVLTHGAGRRRRQ